jgi:hypothetical protein
MSLLKINLSFTEVTQQVSTVSQFSLNALDILPSLIFAIQPSLPLDMRSFGLGGINAPGDQVRSNILYLSEPGPQEPLDHLVEELPEE